MKPVHIEDQKQAARAQRGTKALLRIAAVMLLALFASSIQAQSTEPELQARLLKKQFFLRGLWQKDTLKFNTSGELTTPSESAPFTVCGVMITEVTLTDDKLVLKGHRLGTIFDPNPKVVELREPISIELAGSPGVDYGAGLDKIFTVSFADLVPSLPELWQPFAHKTFLHERSAFTAPMGAPNTAPDSPHVIGKGGATPPVLVKHVEAELSNAARLVKHNSTLAGKITLNVIIDQNGKTTHIQIAKPAGLGLDEEAAKSVAQYIFKPARQNGVPVAVPMNIEVDFAFFQ